MEKARYPQRSVSRSIFRLFLIRTSISAETQAGDMNEKREPILQCLRMTGTHAFKGSQYHWRREERGEAGCFSPSFSSPLPNGTHPQVERSSSSPVLPFTICYIYMPGEELGGAPSLPASTSSRHQNPIQCHRLLSFMFSSTGNHRIQPKIKKKKRTKGDQLKEKKERGTLCVGSALAWSLQGLRSTFWKRL